MLHAEGFAVSHRSMKLAAALLLAASLIAQAEVKVEVGEITDKRQTKKLFAEVRLELKISGSDVAECKGIRVKVNEAKDNSGNVVERGHWAGLYARTQPYEHSAGREKAAVKVDLQSPDRSANALSLDTTVEILNPSMDPASIVVVDLSKVAGKVLEDERLKAAGVSITFRAPRDGGGGYTLEDPRHNNVGSVEFCSADGKTIEFQGCSVMGMGTNFDIFLKQKPALAKVYLFTDKSVVKVPAKFSGIALP